MSFSRSLVGPSSSGLRLATLGLALALSACTAGPLYGPTSVDPVTGQGQSVLDQLAGRIDVQLATTRTAQIVRNSLLFRLNGAEGVSDPLYIVDLAVSGTEQGVSVQGGGSGVPTASIYSMRATYSVRRVSDGVVLGTGSRTTTAPFDRSDQLYAARRALLDARDNAGRDLADRVAAAVLPILQREAFAAPPS
jgi:LPS-assembly lipoprotein